MHACVIGNLLDSSVFYVRIEHLCRASRASSHVSYHYRCRDDSAPNLPRFTLISMQKIKMHELLYESVDGVQVGNNSINFVAVYETKSVKNSLEISLEVAMSTVAHVESSNADIDVYMVTDARAIALNLKIWTMSIFLDVTTTHKIIVTFHYSGEISERHLVQGCIILSNTQVVRFNAITETGPYCTSYVLPTSVMNFLDANQFALGSINATMSCTHHVKGIFLILTANAIYTCIQGLVAINEGINSETGFKLTGCLSNCEIMDMYDSDNCAVLKYHIDHCVIFSASYAFVLHANITTILFNCKSSSVYNICGTRLMLITTRVEHYFTNTDGDEHCMA